ncbi:hypothetical protein Glove_146g46 [Diversispora epigaea]|uniref:m7GpppX diphosphatase n=1 Tax=Diversispora epigaea TaxID=1348612 RepID=A0A397ITW0_9GLOM|nr:hypothetical protein Glove_146g46 [Diversispora epigaea]
MSEINQNELSRTLTSEELKEFKFVRLLNEEPRTKTATILGTLYSQNDSIIVIEKLHFSNDEYEILTKERISQWIPDEKNDIYHWFNGLLNKNEKWPDFKIILIYPATEMHIEKYSYQPRHLVRETPEIYEKVVKPYIESIPKSRIQWVYNILSKKSESEKILLEVEGEEKGFLLFPDMKWDKKTIESLYLQALVYRNDIRSLRDLNGSHLPLLKNLRQQIHEFVPQKYPNVGADELRLFVHYQPSYYHFHVHVTHLRNDIIVGGISIAKAFLLDDIIENLEVFAKDYYERCTLTYVIGENETLFLKLNEAGVKFNSNI